MHIGEQESDIRKRKRHGLFCFLLSAFWFTLWIAPAAALVAWIIGRILTDRFAWSQWCWWIPTPVAMVASALGVLIAIVRPTTRRGLRRQRLLRWSASACAVFVYFLFIEHRFQNRAPTPIGLRIAHWNFSQENITAHSEGIALGAVALDADITVLTGPLAISYQPAILQALAGENGMASAGMVTVLSRLSITAFRPLVATDNITIAKVEFDATSSIGKSIMMYVVDLPSNPRVARMALARKVRAMLDEQAHFPESEIGGVQPSDSVRRAVPDLVIGDFNIPRGSASFDAIFPAMQYAFNQAGHGYGASYNRTWLLPLYHIDHILIGRGFKATRYDLIDPGVGRHLAQVAWIVPSDNE